MLSGPQDLLHLILSRTDWIYETRAGWKEKFSLKSRDEIEEMLGWVENSSRLSFRAGWSKTGVEKNELEKVWRFFDDFAVIYKVNIILGDVPPCGG